MKAFLPPVLTLCALLAFALWNSSAIDRHTARWAEQVADAALLAQAEDWDAAARSLDDAYQDWSSCQTYLHIVEDHDVVDDAEAMYRRAAAFAQAREPSEFQAETADLQDQLRLLAEQERFSIKNIL